MPLVFQKWITRDDLRNNPEHMYVFGDNVLRKGLRGQAKEMRGEPNAIGIPTKWEPTLRPEAFFKDSQFNDIRIHIEPDYNRVLDALQAGKTVVWPEDGIGTGLSRIPKTAPALWNEMTKILTRFKEEYHA